MKILVDSSVWIDYFRGGKDSENLDAFIDENLICTNYLILAEIIPALRMNNQTRLINLLYEVARIPLTINWPDIMDYQTSCLSNGINKVGIADLIIADNAIKNDLILFSLDKHFKLISDQIKLRLYRP